jgi:hypothetical protein
MIQGAGGGVASTEANKDNGNPNVGAHIMLAGILLQLCASSHHGRILDADFPADNSDNSSIRYSWYRILLQIQPPDAYPTPCRQEPSLLGLLDIQQRGGLESARQMHEIDDIRVRYQYTVLIQPVRACSSFKQCPRY